MTSKPYDPKDGSEISPGPFRRVDYPTPFYSWVMDTTGGVVCFGFGSSDAQLLTESWELYNVLLGALTNRALLDPVLRDRAHAAVTRIQESLRVR